jgi:hypothetical protein
MFDKPLIAKIIALIIAQEAEAGIAGLPIKSAFQPTMQGVPTQPAAFIHKISDRRIGSAFRESLWDTTNSIMVLTVMQQYETVFQVSALSRQDPASLTEYTASDILNLVTYTLQTEKTIMELAKTLPHPMGILRITDIRNPYFVNDKGQNDTIPSFDFTITHKQVIISNVPIISSVDYKIYSV